MSPINHDAPIDAAPSTPNGSGTLHTANGSVAVVVPTPSPVRPPDPRFQPRVILRLAMILACAPLLLWVLLAVPRATEITGAAAAGHKSGGGGDKYQVAAMLAAISVLVSLLAIAIKTYTHSHLVARIAAENEEVETAKSEMDTAEQAAVACAESRNRAFGATDALVDTYASALSAIEEYFWEGFYRRHAESPEIYGVWDDVEVAMERHTETFEKVFGRPKILSVEEFKEIITRNRRDRATFRDARVSAING